MIRLGDGIYAGYTFRFSMKMSLDYPLESPVVRCLTAGVFHPNIEGGAVCLSILRLGWTPVMTIFMVVVGLLHIFIEPDPEDPLNEEAAEALRRGPAFLQTLVHRRMPIEQYQ